jgi:CxC1 like cysteine cluster associated with KDZ transposases
MVPSRARLPAASRGTGKHFTSPIKPRDKKKTATYVVPPGHESKRQRLLEKLQALQHPRSPELTSEQASWDPISLEGDDLFSTCPLQDTNDIPSDSAPPIDSIADNPPLQTAKGKKRILPDAESIHLYTTWTNLLPTVIDSLLQYLTRSVGSPILHVSDLRSKCTQSCVTKSFTINCLYFDCKSLYHSTTYSDSILSTDFKSMKVIGCDCQTVPQVLVANGLFPTSPSQPRTAVSLDLLDFYQALFERSCDAVNALASALHTFYTRRGFDVLNKDGRPIRDAFRRGLGYAIQWYDCLRVLVQKQVDRALEASDGRIQAVQLPDLDIHNVTAAPSAYSLEPPTVTPGECARILRERCPACFGGTAFGRTLAE